MPKSLDFGVPEDVCPLNPGSDPLLLSHSASPGTLWLCTLASSSVLPCDSFPCHRPLPAPHRSPLKATDPDAVLSVGHCVAAPSLITAPVTGEGSDPPTSLFTP